MGRFRDSAKRWAARRGKREMADPSSKGFCGGTPEEVTSPRAKSQREGAVTADR
jgi:hypothetical protein